MPATSQHYLLSVHNSEISRLLLLLRHRPINVLPALAVDYACACPNAACTRAARFCADTEITATVDLSEARRRRFVRFVRFVRGAAAAPLCGPTLTTPRRRAAASGIQKTRPRFCVRGGEGVRGGSARRLLVVKKEGTNTFCSGHQSEQNTHASDDLTACSTQPPTIHSLTEEDV